jgi:hypothetical protein
MLEAGGIPTVILGSALDIVEHCGVPRFLFTDFPLGNPCGPPGDRTTQRATVEQALELFENARTPRTTVQAEQRWSSGSWKDSYMQVREEDLVELRRKGAQRRAGRAQQRAEGRIRD